MKKETKKIEQATTKALSKTNVVRCFIAWFKFVGTANWYQGNENPTLWQRVYKWRISPKTAWILAKSIWLDGISK